ncbi:MAG: hypothetical protein IJS42_06010, partial [Synergistaceae bacterium]|nr:hypothetical protein [Synergistaceae bacterium]
VQSWGLDEAHQSSVIALAGDFDGDGVQEAAVVTRTNGLKNVDMRVKVFKYNSGGWTSGELTAYNDFLGTLKATRADLNGDGQDEIVILVIQDSGGTLYPRLEFWGFNRGSITPVRNAHCNKGGAGNTTLLGYSLGGNVYNESYKTAEDFSITAGPLTGTKGHIKLADDIAISHVNSDASRVFVIPSVLNASRDFIAFGDTKTVYNYVGSDSARRGALVTSDFANEVLMLGKPYHTIDDINKSYVTVIQALPYHIDNVPYNGTTLNRYPINYTFSGFEGDEGNGKMCVTYTNESTSTTETNVSFSTASTTETIEALGDVGPYVQGYLKFRATQANIAGNFDERIKAAGQFYTSIMDFVTDKLDSVATETNKSAEKKTEAKTMIAYAQDIISVYKAQQHIWRYKILNKPLPSWYRMGMKADFSSGDVKSDETEHYITFTLNDSNVKYDTTPERDNTYQARHEEGNFFSYPANLSQIEGYNSKGALADETWRTWSKNAENSWTMEFKEEKIKSLGYDEEKKPSELSKTISGVKSVINTVAGWFGADEPFQEEAPIPDSTTNNQTFSRGISTSEQIKVDLYGRSTNPGEEAGHEILTMPFLAHEGTLKVAHAVNLFEDARSRLWSSNSLYKKLPDPSLVLPHKYVRSGANLFPTDNNGAAMLMRGVRFYVPAIDLRSDRELVAGLTYEINVPIYNASFIDTGEFDITLSYAGADVSKKEDYFDIYNPASTMGVLQKIQTISTKLSGWPNNKGWATFTWTVPEDMKTRNYIFFVQIDPPNPEHKINEVHESRLNADGSINDFCGNNEGYFNFSVISKEDLEEKAKVKAAIKAGTYKPEHSDGVIYSAVYAKGQEVDGEVRPAAEIIDRSGNITVDISIEGYGSDKEVVDFIEALWLIATIAKVSPDTVVQAECTVTYDGDEFYPEVYLNGCNLKPGTLDQVAERDYPVEEEIANLFSTHRFSLVPHSTTTFMMNLKPGAIDFLNGAGFEFYVPELHAASVLAEIAESSKSESDTPEDDTPEDDTPEDDTPEDDTSNVTRRKSSGGGCAMGFGALTLIALSGLILRVRREH